MTRPAKDPSSPRRPGGANRPESVQVRIYDREYALRTSDERRRLIELGNALDKRMREVAEASGSVDTLKVAILTALGLIDELERFRQALHNMDEDVSRRSLECVTMLDRSLR
ncbi:MAG: cell division protein ZapA [Acidobacteria bacterium]|nr:cell division protein ZapA [Acidobacteriota bacterium]